MSKSTTPVPDESGTKYQKMQAKWRKGRQELANLTRAYARLKAELDEARKSLAQCSEGMQAGIQKTEKAAATQEAVPAGWVEATTLLLCNVEDVVPQDVWEKLDTEVWNKVTTMIATARQQEVQNFLAQFDDARESIAQWPEWMRNAAGVRSAATQEADLAGWVPTDAELTEIYKRANNEIFGKAQPLTTGRIFTAMRAMLTAAPQSQKEQI